MKSECSSGSSRSQSTVRWLVRRLLGWLEVVVGWRLGVVAATPLLLLLLPLPLLLLLTLLAIAVVVASAPLRNFLKVIGVRPVPVPAAAVGAMGAAVRDVVEVVVVDIAA